MSNSRSRRHHNRAPLDERSVDERSGAMMEDERLPAMVDRSRREQGRGSRPGTTSPAPSSIWSEDSMSFRDFRSKSPSSVSSYAPSRPLSSSDVDRISSANTTRARTAPLRTSPPATSTFFGGFGGGDGSSLNGDAFPFSMQTVQRTKAKLPTLRNPKLDWSRLDELEKPQTQSTVTFQDKVPEQQRDLRYLEEDDLLRREFKLQPKAKSKDSITMVDVFGANVPQFLLRYFLKHRRSVKECDTVQFDGVVMVINLLGFEPMAEKCSSHDAMRVHELKTTVNAFYGSLVRIIVRDFGGDVLAIEGEDIVAIFGQPTPSVAIKTVEPHNNTQKGNTPKAGRSQPSKQAVEFNFNKMMHIALQCALEIQQSYGETILNNTKVSLRAAVGAGKLNCLFLGGVKGVWHYVLASDVLVFLSRALLSCPPGEVVVPSECWQHAAGCQGTRVSGGEWSVISVPSRGTQAFKPTATRATSEIIESIRPFIPLCVLDSLDDGYGELASAMRRITCVHLTINNMCFAKTENPDCFRFQQLITNVQRIFYHAGGTIHSISMSHSSTTLIILFGIPPTANTDDPARAVKATIHAKNALNEARLDLSVGISTGSVFCGSLGIPLIREQFVVLGSVPSLALLLAGVANEHGGVIVDEKTYELARDDVDFESRKATLLEGLFFPVPIYRPKGFEFVAGYDQKIIARDEEKALMRHELRLLLQGGDGRVIVFEGDKGVGKTALLLFVLEQAEGFSIRHLSTSAEHVPHSQHKPFAPFAILIRQMFGGQDAEDATIRDNLMTILKAESPRKWVWFTFILDWPNIEINDDSGVLFLLISFLISLFSFSFFFPCNMHICISFFVSQVPDDYVFNVFLFVDTASVRISSRKQEDP
eukprot:TRINITY_DN4119_c0_g1_i2.p1 TRINITY_DN4119_c0_g1~~TRINITY_DN4119_c0_g1_i2.p1  ORF type:complete len:875 (+),score=96.99 TRINITY_DN4119_c0_g1_i2:53-2677(+)